MSDIERIQVGDEDGCRIFLVCREVGTTGYNRNVLTNGGRYWTAVIETLPSEEKTMAYNGGKRFERRGKAEKATLAYMQSRKEHR